MVTQDSLNTTSYAVLGQLALRPWTGYEMTQNVKRTLRWFWPRAESVLYEELKRLAGLGLASVSVAAGLRGRTRSTYEITDAGRDALADWLATKPARTTLHSEALLRVHLAPFGTSDDLIEALQAARAEAQALLRQALLIGSEFASGEHQFQDQVHIRAILFDYLWGYAMLLTDWSERWSDVVAQWPDLDASYERLEQGRLEIERVLADYAGETLPAPPKTGAAE